MIDILKNIFNSDVLFSAKDVFDLEKQTARSENAILYIPSLILNINTVLKAAPYLVFINLIISATLIQNQIFNREPAAIVFSLFVMILLTNVANGIAYAEVKNTLINDKTNRIESVDIYTVKKLPHLVGTIFISSIAVISGTIFFFVPGIYLSIKTLLATPACIIDNLSARESITASFKNTRYNKLKIIAAVGAFSFLLLPAGLITLVTRGLTQSIFTGVLFGVLPPLLHTGLGILYLDAKENTEFKLTLTKTKHRITNPEDAH